MSRYFSGFPPTLWAALFVATMLLSGCNQTYPLVLDRAVTRADTLTLPRMNTRFAGRYVTLHQASGADVQGTYLGATQDSLFVRPDNTSVQMGLSMAAIHSLEWRDHWGGVARGFFLGMAGGIAIVGLVAGIIKTSSGDLGAALLGGLVILASPIVGAIIDGTHGVRSTVVFPAGRPSSVSLPERGPDTLNTRKRTDESTIVTPSDSSTRGTSTPEHL
jgi:hypothetical protein